MYAYLLLSVCLFLIKVKSVNTPDCSLIFAQSVWMPACRPARQPIRLSVVWLPVYPVCLSLSLSYCPFLMLLRVTRKLISWIISEVHVISRKQPPPPKKKKREKVLEQRWRKSVDKGQEKFLFLASHWTDTSPIAHSDKKASRFKQRPLEAGNVVYSAVTAFLIDMKVERRAHYVPIPPLVKCQAW